MKELPGTPLLLVEEADLAGAPPPSPEEERHLATLVHPKRRAEWLLGRLAGKLAVARLSGAPLADISIIASPDGAPLVLRRGEPLRCGLSLSHGHGRAIAWALEGGRPGVDLERVKPRPEGTFRFYLEPREREPLLALSGAERDAAAVVLWSVKEAVWKTLSPGRGVALLDFEVAPFDLRVSEGEVTATPRGAAVPLAEAAGVSRVKARFVRRDDLVYSWAVAE